MLNVFLIAFCILNFSLASKRGLPSFLNEVDQVSTDEWSGGLGDLSPNGAETMVVHGDGHFSIEFRDGQPFGEIIVPDADKPKMTVRHRLSSLKCVEVHGDRNILPYVITEYSGGNLIIRIHEGVKLTIVNPIKVFVHSDDESRPRDVY